MLGGNVSVNSQDVGTLPVTEIAQTASEDVNVRMVLHVVVLEAQPSGNHEIVCIHAHQIFAPRQAEQQVDGANIIVRRPV